LHYYYRQHHHGREVEFDNWIGENDGVDGTGWACCARYGVS
jgi:hypothetical protein